YWAPKLRPPMIRGYGIDAMCVHDAEHNNAVALAEYLDALQSESFLGSAGRAGRCRSSPERRQPRLEVEQGADGGAKAQRFPDRPRPCGLRQLGPLLVVQAAPPTQSPVRMNRVPREAASQGGGPATNPAAVQP